jgi:hypothetical protein
MNHPPRPATLDYLAEVAKDWAVSRFAGAEDSDFVLMPHRFELHGHTVRRRSITPEGHEAADPLKAAGRPPDPILWARSDVVTLLADSHSGPIEFEQEIIEILGVEDDDVLAEVAFVVRIPGLPPCLGPFWTAT